jgi:hypothetical protein
MTYTIARDGLIRRRSHKTDGGACPRRAAVLARALRPGLLMPASIRPAQGLVKRHGAAHNLRAGRKTRANPSHTPCQARCPCPTVRAEPTGGGVAGLEDQ